MDFDIAATVRAALPEAVDREDFGYVEADLAELKLFIGKDNTFVWVPVTDVEID